MQLVGDLRGRMLVLQDWPGADCTVRWAGPAMKVQDLWSPGSAKEKWVAIRKHLRGAPRRQGDRLCANFVSAQPLGSFKNPLGAALRGPSRGVRLDISRAS